MNNRDIDNETVKESTDQELANLIQQASHIQDEINYLNLVDVHSELSFAQKRMWFLNELDPKSSAYVITIAYELKGLLDINALKLSIKSLLKRHELLRSYYPSIHGSPVKKIDNDLELELNVIAIDTHAVTNYELEIQTHLDNCTRTSFDIAKPPLIRFDLLSIQNDWYVLVISLHHIIADGWSMDVLIRDLNESYNAYRIGREPIYSTVPGSYAQYIKQTDTVIDKTNAYKKSLAYWQAQLSDYQLLNFPYDYPRPQNQRFCGTKYEKYFDLELTKKLEEICKANSSTLYMGLMTIFNFVLARYTGQNDILIGTPVANRNQIEDENTIGLFVNSLSIRVKFKDNPSFIEALNEIKAVTLSAFEHQQVPFDKIVELIHPQRTLSHNPIFQVMFALQNAENEIISFDNIAATAVNPASQVARFDLESTYWRTPTGLKWEIVYNTDLISKAKCLQIAEHFEAILKLIVADSTIRLWDINYLNQNEIAQLMEYSKGKITYQADTHEKCIHEIIKNTAQKFGEKIAIKTTTQCLTYSELDQKSDYLARFLCSRYNSAHKKHAIAVCMPPDINLAITIIAVIKAGMVLIPLNYEDPAERLNFILDDSDATAIISHDISLTKKKFKVPELDYSEIMQQLSAQSMSIDLPILESTELAYIIYTSGTTGKPKGVLIEHRNLINTLQSCCRIFEFSNTDIFGCVSVFSFDIFFFEFFSALMVGGATYLINKNELFDAEVISLVMQEITCMQAVPGVAKRLIEVLHSKDIYSCHSMRQFTTGGDTVNKNVLDLLSKQFPQAEISVTYGPTETAILASRYVALDLSKDGFYPIGKPLDNVIILIGDEHQNILPVGVPGEIYIGGQGVSRGYLNREELNEQKYIHFKEGRFFRTGDIGRWLPTGNIEFMGRADNQVKIRGHRIELGEINSVLLSHPLVKDVVTIDNITSDNDKNLISYVVPNDNFSLNHITEIKDFERVNHWQTLFDETHNNTINNQTIAADFTGWNSIITGKPLPLEEMNGWLDGTVQAILMLVDQAKIKSKSLRILEVGCGTGLVLFRLAKFANQYIATDFSATIIEQLKNTIHKTDLNNVQLMQATADSITKENFGCFDLIIVNSVVQYFPSAEYLARVLKNLTACLNNNGAIFLGDIRDYSTLNLLYTSVIHSKQKKTVNNISQLQAYIKYYIENEKELCISPGYFKSFFSKVSEFLSVNIQPRLDKFDNELSKYRYNVIVRSNTEINIPVKLGKLDWSKDGLTRVKLKEVLESTNDVLAVKNIPNRRIISENDKFYKLQEDFSLFLNDYNHYQLYAAFETINPYLLYQLAEESGFDFKISYSENSFPNYIDAIFVKKGLEPNIDILNINWGYADGNAYEIKLTEPKKQLYRIEAKKTLKGFLQQKLPNYMIPAYIEIVDHIPLTNHGKVDKKLLPTPMINQLSNNHKHAPRNELEEKIHSAVCQVLGHEAIGIDDNFFDIGGNSLLAIQVAIKLRKNNIHLKPQALFKYQTIRELSESIFSTSREDDSYSDKLNITKNATDVIEINFQQQVKFVVNKNIKSVLLVGATGFLGIHILNSLLEQDIKIYCIVRKISDKSAIDRFFDLYKWYFPNTDKYQLFQKVEVIEGDISVDKFMLMPEQWVALTQKIDTVINAAANVSHVGKSEDLYSVNFAGVKNLIEFCKTGKEKILHHVSTIGIKGLYDKDQVFLDETMLYIEQIHTEDYSKSKYDAEVLIQDFIKCGGRANVYRVGTIAPHYETGTFQKNIGEHFLSRYIKSTVSAGIAAKWSDVTLHLTPVNIMSDAILAIVFNGQHNNQNFHIMTPHAITYYDLINFLQNCGYPIRVMRAKEFKNKIFTLDQSEKYESSLSGIIQIIDTCDINHNGISCAATNKILNQLNFSYPIVDENYLKRFIDHCVQVGFLPIPNYWNNIVTLPELMNQFIEVGIG